MENAYVHPVYGNVVCYDDRCFSDELVTNVARHKKKRNYRIHFKLTDKVLADQNLTASSVVRFLFDMTEPAACDVLDFSEFTLDGEALGMLLTMLIERPEYVPSVDLSGKLFDDGTTEMLLLLVRKTMLCEPCGCLQRLVLYDTNLTAGTIGRIAELIPTVDAAARCIQVLPNPFRLLENLQRGVRRYEEPTSTAFTTDDELAYVVWSGVVRPLRRENTRSRRVTLRAIEMLTKIGVVDDFFFDIFICAAVFLLSANFQFDSFVVADLVDVNKLHKLVSALRCNCGAALHHLRYIEFCNCDTPKSVRDVMSNETHRSISAELASFLSANSSGLLRCVALTGVQVESRYPRVLKDGLAPNAESIRPELVISPYQFTTYDESSILSLDASFEPFYSRLWFNGENNTLSLGDLPSDARTIPALCALLSQRSNIDRLRIDSFANAVFLQRLLGGLDGKTSCRQIEIAGDIVDEANLQQLAQSYPFFRLSRRLAVRSSIKPVGAKHEFVVEQGAAKKSIGMVYALTVRNETVKKHPRGAMPQYMLDLYKAAREKMPPTAEGKFPDEIHLNFTDVTELSDTDLAAVIELFADPSNGVTLMPSMNFCGSRAGPRVQEVFDKLLMPYYGTNIDPSWFQAAGLERLRFHFDDTEINCQWLWSMQSRNDHPRWLDLNPPLFFVAQSKADFAHLSLKEIVVNASTINRFTDYGGLRAKYVNEEPLFIFANPSVKATKFERYVTILQTSNSAIVAAHMETHMCFEPPGLIMSKLKLALRHLETFVMSGEIYWFNKNAQFSGDNRRDVGPIERLEIIGQHKQTIKEMSTSMFAMHPKLHHILLDLQKFPAWLVDSLKQYVETLNVQRSMTNGNIPQIIVIYDQPISLYYISNPGALRARHADVGGDVVVAVEPVELVASAFPVKFSELWYLVSRPGHCIRSLVLNPFSLGALPDELEMIYEHALYPLSRIILTKDPGVGVLDSLRTKYAGTGRPQLLLQSDVDMSKPAPDVYSYSASSSGATKRRLVGTRLPSIKRPESFRELLEFMTNKTAKGAAFDWSKVDLRYLKSKTEADLRLSRITPRMDEMLANPIFNKLRKVLLGERFSSVDDVVTLLKDLPRRVKVEFDFTHLKFGPKPLTDAIDRFQRKVAEHGASSEQLNELVQSVKFRVNPHYEKLIKKLHALKDGFRYPIGVKESAGFVEAEKRMIGAKLTIDAKRTERESDFYFPKTFDELVAIIESGDIENLSELGKIDFSALRSMQAIDVSVRTDKLSETLLTIANLPAFKKVLCILIRGNIIPLEKIHELLAQLPREFSVYVDLFNTRETVQTLLSSFNWFMPDTYMGRNLPWRGASLVINLNPANGDVYRSIETKRYDVNVLHVDTTAGSIVFDRIDEKNAVFVDLMGLRKTTDNGFLFMNSFVMTTAGRPNTPSFASTWALARSLMSEVVVFQFTGARLSWYVLEQLLDDGQTYPNLQVLDFSDMRYLYLESVGDLEKAMETIKEVRPESKIGFTTSPWDLANREVEKAQLNDLKKKLVSTSVEHIRAKFPNLRGLLMNSTDDAAYNPWDDRLQFERMLTNAGWLQTRKTTYYFADDYLESDIFTSADFEDRLFYIWPTNRTLLVSRFVNNRSERAYGRDQFFNMLGANIHGCEILDFANVDLNNFVPPDPSVRFPFVKVLIIAGCSNDNATIQSYLTNHYHQFVDLRAIYMDDPLKLGVQLAATLHKSKIELRDGRPSYAENIEMPLHQPETAEDWAALEQQQREMQNTPLTVDVANSILDAFRPSPKVTTDVFVAHDDAVDVDRIPEVDVEMISAVPSSEIVLHEPPAPAVVDPAVEQERKELREVAKEHMENREKIAEIVALGLDVPHHSMSFSQELEKSGLSVLSNFYSAQEIADAVASLEVDLKAVPYIAEDAGSRTAFAADPSPLTSGEYHLGHHFHASRLFRLKIIKAFADHLSHFPFLNNQYHKVFCVPGPNYRRVHGKVINGIAAKKQGFPPRAKVYHEFVAILNLSPEKVRFTLAPGTQTYDPERIGYALSEKDARPLMGMDGGVNAFVELHLEPGQVLVYSNELVKRRIQETIKAGGHLVSCTLVLTNEEVGMIPDDAIQQAIANFGVFPMANGVPTWIFPLATDRTYAARLEQHVALFDQRIPRKPFTYIDGRPVQIVEPAIGPPSQYFIFPKTGGFFESYKPGEREILSPQTIPALEQKAAQLEHTAMVVEEDAAEKTEQQIAPTSTVREAFTKTKESMDRMARWTAAAASLFGTNARIAAMNFDLVGEYFAMRMDLSTADGDKSVRITGIRKKDADKLKETIISQKLAAADFLMLRRIGVEALSRDFKFVIMLTANFDGRDEDKVLSIPTVPTLADLQVSVGLSAAPESSSSASESSSSSGGSNAGSEATESSEAGEPEADADLEERIEKWNNTVAKYEESFGESRLRVAANKNPAFGSILLFAGDELLLEFKNLKDPGAFAIEKKEKLDGKKRRVELKKITIKLSGDKKWLNLFFGFLVDGKKVGLLAQAKRAGSRNQFKIVEHAESMEADEDDDQEMADAETAEVTAEDAQTRVFMGIRTANNQSMMTIYSKFNPLQVVNAKVQFKPMYRLDIEAKHATSGRVFRISIFNQSKLSLKRKEDGPGYYRQITVFYNNWVHNKTTTELYFVNNSIQYNTGGGEHFSVLDLPVYMDETNLNVFTVISAEEGFITDDRFGQVQRQYEKDASTFQKKYEEDNSEVEMMPELTVAPIKEKKSRFSRTVFDAESVEEFMKTQWNKYRTPTTVSLRYQENEKYFKESQFQEALIVMTIKTDGSMIYFNKIGRKFITILLHAEDSTVFFNVDQPRRMLLLRYKDSVTLKLDALRILEKKLEASIADEELKVSLQGVADGKTAGSAVLTAARNKMRKVKNAITYYDLRDDTIGSDNPAFARRMDELKEDMFEMTVANARGQLPPRADKDADPYARTHEISMSDITEVLVLHDADVKMTFLNFRNKKSVSLLEGDETTDATEELEEHEASDD